MCYIYYLDLEGIAIIVANPVELRVDCVGSLVVIVVDDFPPIIFNCELFTNLLKKTID